MVENSAATQGLPKTIKNKIESKLKLLQNNSEAKLDKLVEKQEKHDPNQLSALQIFGV